MIVRKFPEYVKHGGGWLHGVGVGAATPGGGRHVSQGVLVILDLLSTWVFSV